MRFTPSLVVALLLASAAPALAQDDGGLPPPANVPAPANADSSDPNGALATPSTPATPAADANDAYGPHPQGTMLAPVRQRIIATALGEVGKVSDRGGENGFKKGWEELKRYYDEASDWGPDCFTRGGGIQQGVQLAGRSAPGGEWCGIFAAWCYTQAGVATKWKFGVGPRPLVPHYDVQNIAPGDIGVIAQNVHHFVVVKRDGSSLWTVSGNSYFHEVRRDSPRPLSEIRYYYRPTDAVWVANDGTATPVAAPATGGIAGAIDAVTNVDGGAAAPALGGVPGDAGHPLLRQGASGEAVKRLQRLLVAAGSTLDVDGQFGARTDAAVREFQSAHGCRVDGIVGPQTWGALESSPASTTAPNASAPASGDGAPNASTPGAPNASGDGSLSSNDDGGICSPDRPDPAPASSQP